MIDWSQPVQTRHDKPRAARLMDGRGPGGQRRVAIIGDYPLSLVPTGTKSIAAGAFTGDFENGGGWPTIFLFDEGGRCNSGGADSPFDLVNVADTLAKAA